MVNPVLTDAFRKADDTLCKNKTDEIDPLLIAEYARFKNLEPTRMSSKNAEKLKQLTRHRHHLVNERTALKNRLTAVDDRAFPELSGLFDTKARDTATEHAALREIGMTGAVTKADIRTLAKAVKRVSRGRQVRIRSPYFGDCYNSLAARANATTWPHPGCARKLCGATLAALRERRPYERRPSTQSQQERPAEG